MLFDYAIRFDSDDINLPIRFKSLIDKIEFHDYDLIGSHIDEFKGDTLQHFVSTRIVPTNYNGIKKSICYRNPFNHPSVAFRIKAVNKVGGYEDVPFLKTGFYGLK